MNLIHCVVAEDDHASRKKILESIDKIEFLVVSGIVKNADELGQILEFREIEVLFINMEMPGLHRLDLSGRNHLPLLINTNHDVNGNRQFQASVFGSLVRSFLQEDIASVADNVKNVLSMLIPSPRKADCFYVRCEGKYEKLIMEDIAYISGMQNYIKIHFINARPMIVHSPLKSIFRQLDSRRFAMVHKSYIVNLSHISEFSGNYLSVPGHDRIPIGRHFKAGVIPRLCAA